MQAVWVAAVAVGGMIGLIIGFAVAWGLRGRQAARAARDGESRLAELRESRDADRAALEALRQTHHELEATLRAREAEFAARRQALEEKIELLQNAEKQLTQQFENLAHRIFEDKTTQFRKASGEQLVQLLRPFREQIEGLHRDVKEASKERHSLRDEIQRIVTETHALTNALRHDTRHQGNWGELVLERLLEDSGLRKGREYEVQAHYTVSDEAGQHRLRPDVVIHLPEERDIVIDSKVSLSAYEQFVNAETPAEREAHLNAHVQSLQKHIKELAGKYEGIPEIRTLDFTLLWVPLEPAYFAAMQAEPGLIQLALERRVIPVCATTLFAVLKVVERIWQYERQGNNVRAIIERASSLYDKFVGFTESMDDIGQRLEQAQHSYHEARGRLIDGRGNVVRQVEMLREMGATPKKQLSGDWAADGGSPDAPALDDGDDDT